MSTVKMEFYTLSLDSRNEVKLTTEGTTSRRVLWLFLLFVDIYTIGKNSRAYDLKTILRLRSDDFCGNGE